MVRKVRLPSVGFVLLDKGELASVALYKAVLVEFLSMVLFLFITLSTVYTNCSGKNSFRSRCACFPSNLCSDLTDFDSGCTKSD